jgi:hypothetical protein
MNYYVHLCVYCTQRASRGICLHPVVGLCFIHSMLAIHSNQVILVLAVILISVSSVLHFL